MTFTIEKEKFVSKRDYMITAIVSVYNCERFIAGCLEDLERQTIANKLEIVVVNSGSQQNEEPIIKEFQRKYDNIIYIKTENRETLYQAWNRGIEASSGKYITNANSDDRHRKDALEIMVRELENDESIGLVYYNFKVTETENETFDNCTLVGYQDWPDPDKYILAARPCFGHQTMWRKKLHEKCGYFDARFKIAGDYDFWVRLFTRCKFRHINEYLGLYLKNPNSLERSSFEVLVSEMISVGNKYMDIAINDRKLLKALKRRQGMRYYSLGCIYLEDKKLRLARKAFTRSIIYKWYNFGSCKGLLISYFNPRIAHILRKAIREFRRFFSKSIKGKYNFFRDANKAIYFFKSRLYRK